MKKLDNKLEWRVNTPELLREILRNNDTDILRVPLNIFQSILAELSEVAIKINDKELNKCMLKLGLYDICNPKSPDFDLNAVTEYLKS